MSSPIDVAALIAAAQAAAAARKNRPAEHFWPKIKAWLKTREGPQPLPTCPVCYVEMDICGIDLVPGATEGVMAAILPCGHLTCHNCQFAMIERSDQIARQAFVDGEPAEPVPGCPICRTVPSGQHIDCGHHIHYHLPTHEVEWPYSAWVDQVPLTTSEGGKLPQFCIGCDHFDKVYPNAYDEDENNDNADNDDAEEEEADVNIVTTTTTTTTSTTTTTTTTDNTTTQTETVTHKGPHPHCDYYVHIYNDILAEYNYRVAHRSAIATVHQQAAGAAETDDQGESHSAAMNIVIPGRDAFEVYAEFIASLNDDNFEHFHDQLQFREAGPFVGANGDYHWYYVQPPRRVIENHTERPGETVEEGEDGVYETQTGVRDWDDDEVE